MARFGPGVFVTRHHRFPPCDSASPPAPSAADSRRVASSRNTAPCPACASARMTRTVAASSPCAHSSVASADPDPRSGGVFVRSVLRRRWRIASVLKSTLGRSKTPRAFFDILPVIGVQAHLLGRNPDLRGGLGEFLSRGADANYTPSRCRSARGRAAAGRRRSGGVARVRPIRTSTAVELRPQPVASAEVDWLETAHCLSGLPCAIPDCRDRTPAPQRSRGNPGRTPWRRQVKCISGRLNAQRRTTVHLTCP